jgi:hypothetical protein
MKENQTMLRKSLLVGFSVLALAGAGFAEGTRVVLVGVMSDSHCGLKHSQASADAAKCVIGCASKGADYVLVSDGKIYKFEKKNDFYSNFAGKNVQVVGTLTGDTFRASDIGVEELLGAPPKNLQLFQGFLKSSGGKFTLKTEDKVYQIDTETSADKGKQLPDLDGRPVEIIGTREGGTIHMREVQTQ